MSDTRFIDFNVLKRAYEVLRNIINNNKKSTDASISDVSIRADSALAATESLANDAENYATKDQLEQHRLLAESKYATKEELQSSIGGVISFQFTIVDELPIEGVSQIVYLIRNDTSSGDNAYNEYLWIEASSKYERIGSMDLDLSGYLTEDNASNIYATKEQLIAELLNKSNTGHTHNYAGSSSVGGAAISASKLATARNIAITGAVTGDANFDGSGNISIVTDVNHTHNYAGSSSAGGSAASAVKLATARTIAISGAVSGSANFDGSSDITIDTTVQYGEEAPTVLDNGVLYCVIES